MITLKYPKCHRLETGCRVRDITNTEWYKKGAEGDVTEIIINKLDHKKIINIKFNKGNYNGFSNSWYGFAEHFVVV